MLRLKGLGVYITIEGRCFSCDKSVLRMLCWGADLTTEKRQPDCRTPECPHRAAAGGADYRENCELEFAAPEMKKAAENSAAVGKNPHSYPKSRKPQGI